MDDNAPLFDDDGFPGFSPPRVFHRLTDTDASRLLPEGAYDLLSALSPDRLQGDSRDQTLADLFSLELAIGDPVRRALLISTLPAPKLNELEARLGSPLTSLPDPMPHASRRAFMGFFGQSAPTDPVPSQPPDSIEISPNRPLFSHQKDVASRVEDFLYRQTGRVMLHLPTGTGKTRTAMSVVASHLRTRTPGLVIWLATTRELLEQAALEFEAAWARTGDRPIQCLRFWGSHSPPIDGIHDGVIVAGLAKLNAFGRNRHRIWRLGDRTTMLVFDEAHQAVATTYRDTLETIVTRNPQTPLLGLSATPGRTWSDIDIDSEVADLFHRNKVTLDFDGANPIAHLTAHGYLAQVEFSQLNVHPGIDLSQTDLDQLHSALDIPEPLAERLGNDTERNLRIIQRLTHLAQRHQRVLVFAPSVSSATLLANVSRGLGLHADVITGTTDERDRSSIIRGFTRLGGPRRILFNYGVLTTGFDAPAASAAVIARPTKSLVLYSQMLGRVIRGPKAGGTPTCEVVTVVDTNLPGFRDHAEAFMNWEDVWQTV